MRPGRKGKERGSEGDPRNGTRNRTSKDRVWAGRGGEKRGEEGARRGEGGGSALGRRGRERVGEKGEGARRGEGRGSASWGRASEHVGFTAASVYAYVAVFPIECVWVCGCRRRSCVRRRDFLSGCGCVWVCVRRRRSSAFLRVCTDGQRASCVVPVHPSGISVSCPLPRACASFQFSYAFASTPPPHPSSAPTDAPQTTKSASTPNPRREIQNHNLSGRATCCAKTKKSAPRSLSSSSARSS
ncbi:hypothetical protein B0H14DRAFT_365188 [Mycena olivaceomarginata]|nr:hypothetical protein B0H14DRAFT_365188 [Mycena olivaceomarginata]